MVSDNTTLTNPHTGQRGHTATLLRHGEPPSWRCDSCGIHLLGYADLYHHRLGEEVKRLEWELAYLQEAAQAVVCDCLDDLEDPNIEELRYRLGEHDG